MPEKIEERSESGTGGRILYITILNVLACFAVVMIHCSNAAFWGYRDDRNWVIGNIIETTCYFAVPVFFMLGGATLVDYRERYDDKTFLRKRLGKTVIPFLIWSALAYVRAMIWWCGGKFDLSPTYIINGALNSSFMPIYWFFLPLFAIYLSMPLLTRVQEKVKVFRYAAILGVVFVAILPSMCGLIGVNYNTALTPPIVLGYMVYALIGYNLSKVDLTPKLRWVIYGCGILGWVMQFAGTWVLSAEAGEVVRTFKGYTNLPALMQSVAVFVAVKYAVQRWSDRRTILRPKWRMRLRQSERWLNAVAKTTFGVYLLHGFIVYDLPGMMGVEARSLRWQFLGTITVFVGCVAVIWVVQRIPILRRIVS